MKLGIKWTDDCQGKKDYDGDIVCISTRYWPPSREYGHKHTATCCVMIGDGYPNFNHHSMIIADKEFEGDSFEEIREQVEVWAQKQASHVYRILIAALFKADV